MTRLVTRPSRLWKCESLDVREVSILCEDAQTLIAGLDQEISLDYAPEHRHAVDFEPFHRSGGIFVIAYESETPAGCGALRPLDRSDVELKRMYVAPPYRGRGISRLILTHLESKATQLGYVRLMLETGDSQLTAIRLYETSGYTRIEPFGEYIGGPRSVCFAKRLA